MQHQIGDRVRLVKPLNMGTEDDPDFVEPGITGTVVDVVYSFTNPRELFRTYPYDVRFDGYGGRAPVNPNEIEAAKE